MRIEEIARTCHEVNRAYCLSIGDHSQKPWEQAPEWQKNSAIQGVLFHRENQESTPEDSHANWMKQKHAEGWQYGETKDPEAKTHPALKGYNELPQEQRTKDFLFLAIVRSLEPLLRGE